MTPTRRAWDGLADAESARIDRPMPVARFVRSEDVRLEGGDLVFRMPVSFEERQQALRTGEPPSVLYMRVPPDLLERFLSLTSDESILKFAQKFGSLTGYGEVRLYSAAMSAAWEELLESKRPELGVERATRAIRAGEPIRESLKLWRRCQKDFEVILALASGLNEATGPKRAVFDQYEAQRLGAVRQRRLSTPEGCRRETARILTWSTQKLSLYVGLQPSLRFRATQQGDFRAELMFEDSLAREWDLPAISVLGGLVVQLLAATAGNGFAMCASCGRAFVPKRKPAVGRRSYCPSCGRRAAMRDAKAAQRRRERALKQTAEAPRIRKG